MKNFKSVGTSVTVVADQGYSGGDGISLADRAGVCQHDVLTGANVEVALEGVFTVAKLNTDAPTAGQKAYWNTSSKYATISSSSAKALGWYMATAASGGVTADVKLGGF